MKIITNDTIIKINEMYLEGKNIKTIANTLSISPYTVKKNIENLKEENNINIIKFNISLPDFDTTIFRNKDWGELCVLSEIETEEVRKLWREIEF